MGIPRNFADPVKRLVAYIIDALILGVVSSLIASIGMAPMIMSLAGTAIFQNPEAAMGVTLAGIGLFMLSLLAIAALFFLYFAVQESGKHQATFGKRAMKLYVTDMNGNRLTFGKALLRVFGRIVNSFTMLIGYAICLWTDYKQGLHDMIAGTLVLDGLSDQIDEFEAY